MKRQGIETSEIVRDRDNYGNWKLVAIETLGVINDYEDYSGFITPVTETTSAKLGQNNVTYHQVNNIGKDYVNQVERHIRNNIPTLK